MGQSRLDDLARKAGRLALNPIDERNRDGGVPSLGDTADEVRESLSAGFRNEHMAQWKSTLETMGHLCEPSRSTPSPPTTCWLPLAELDH
jgi:hypothetical protein